jgi:hypothetical protein
MIARAGLALLLVASVASADDGVVKKDKARAAKSTKHGPPPAPGTRPAKLINLYNSWTHEWLAVDPERLPTGAVVDRFLRDHFTNEVWRSPPRRTSAATS